MEIVSTQQMRELESLSEKSGIKTETLQNKAGLQIARKLIIKASKKFKIKIIEGGYKPKEKVFKMKKFDFAKVKKGDKTIGQLEFAVSRFGNAEWEIQDEERH